MFHGLNRYIYYPPACRLFSPERAADTYRISCYNTRNSISPLVAVRIHHPCHDMLIGSNIRGRYIMVPANQGEYLGSIASCEALQLPLRHILWTASYTPLCTTVR